MGRLSRICHFRVTGAKRARLIESVRSDYAQSRAINQRTEAVRMHERRSQLLATAAVNPWNSSRLGATRRDNRTSSRPQTLWSAAAPLAHAFAFHSSHSSQPRIRKRCRALY